jgi:hypothetical protein
VTASDIVDSLTASLRDIHAGRVSAPINLPTATGAFPSSYLVDPRPVVPDANILRNDLLYACRRRRRTTLVNGANSGFLRLFCAQHVVAEVWEHSLEWSERGQVAPAAFESSWQSEYLPLIRVVSDASLLSDWLSPVETRPAPGAQRG